MINYDSMFKYSIEFSPDVEADAIYFRKLILFSAYKNIVNKYGYFHYNDSMILPQIFYKF